MRQDDQSYGYIGSLNRLLHTKSHLAIIAKVSRNGRKDADVFQRSINMHDGRSPPQLSSAQIPALLLHVGFRAALFRRQFPRLASGLQADQAVTPDRLKTTIMIFLQKSAG